MTRSYSEMASYATFEDRLKYLMIPGAIGKETFGEMRYLNQDFYSSYEWREARRKVIVRDLGLDLAFPGHDIFDPAKAEFAKYRPKLKRYKGPVVHHINPITVEDIIEGNPAVLDLNNLVLVSDRTHQIIHYGNDSQLITYGFVDRKPNDTCPWKEVGYGG